MKRSRLLLQTVLVLAFLSAATIIARIWGIAFTDDVTMFKLLGSYLIAGVMAAFAVMVLVDYQDHKMKRLLLTLLLVGECLGFLVLIQIWLKIFIWVTFAKIAGSLVIAGILIGFIMAAIEDFDEDKDLKKKNYLD